MPRKVLKEQYEGALEPDETEDEFSNDEDDDFDIYDAGNEFIRESAASPPAPNIEGIAKDNFTKDINDISAKSPPHKSNGFDFGKYAHLYLIISYLDYLTNIRELQCDISWPDVAKCS